MEKTDDEILAIVEKKMSNSKKMKPKGKKGMAMVKKLGRNYKTGGFDAITAKVAARYQSKGKSSEQAEEIGQKVAGKIFWNKVKNK